ncbi:MAG: hypothetical protein LBP76_09420, partial [Treponema sp.]|nr:hypothetical protein [Treponema sp.]
MADDISYKASFDINFADLKEGIKDVEAYLKKMTDAAKNTDSGMKQAFSGAQNELKQLNVAGVTIGKLFSAG